MTLSLLGAHKPVILRMGTLLRCEDATTRFNAPLARAELDDLFLDTARRAERFVVKLLAQRARDSMYAHSGYVLEVRELSWLLRGCPLISRNGEQ